MRFYLHDLRRESHEERLDSTVAKAWVHDHQLYAAEALAGASIRLRARLRGSCDRSPLANARNRLGMYSGENSCCVCWHCWMSVIKEVVCVCCAEK